MIAWIVLERGEQARQRDRFAYMTKPHAAGTPPVSRDQLALFGNPRLAVHVRKKIYQVNGEHAPHDDAKEVCIDLERLLQWRGEAPARKKIVVDAKVRKRQQKKIDP